MLEIKAREGLGRIAIFSHRDRKVETPALMPVINPNIPTITPREMWERFGVRAIITNSYIIWKNPHLREEALSRGLHAMLDFPGIIMTDSGTFQSHVYGDVEVSNREIVLFQREIGSDIGTILDVFSEPDQAHGEVRRAIEETARRGKEALGIRGDMLLAGPVQGSVYPDLRAYAARLMNSLNFDYYPIGGVVPLLENYRYAEVVEAVIRAKMEIRPSRPVHLFGAGHPMVFAISVLAGVDFFDSSSYVKYAYDDRILFPFGTRDLKNLSHIPYPSPYLEKYGVDGLRELPREERVGVIARHNLYVSVREMEAIKQRIREGSLWEYVEERARCHPTLLKAYRRLLRYSRFIEEYEPVSKRTGFFYTGYESLLRPAVIRARWRASRVRSEMKVRTPFGEVPAELMETYPFGQGEFPWGEGYGHEGIDGRPAVPEVEPLARVRAIADYQFLPGAGDALFSGHVDIITSKRTGKIRNILVDGVHVASVRAHDGLLTLRFPGGERLKEAFPPPFFRVVVNRDSAEFNAVGRNVFAKFVVDAWEGIRPGDEVLIVTEEDELVAVGRALMNRREMLDFEHGMCVDVKDYRNRKGGPEENGVGQVS